MKNYMVEGRLVKARSFRDAVRKEIEEPYGYELHTMVKLGGYPARAVVSVKHNGAWKKNFRAMVVELPPEVITVNWGYYNSLN